MNDDLLQTELKAAAKAGQEVMGQGKAFPIRIQDPQGDILEIESVRFSPMDGGIIIIEAFDE